MNKLARKMLQRLKKLRDETMSQYFEWLADEDLELIAVEMAKIADLDALGGTVERN